MTGNKVELYKVPWAYGGIRQPYFLSDTSRSSFFNGLTNSLVVADNGVNIKLDFNFEIETVVNADITAVQDYNFGIITYNNHKYYADIIDIEMVNVGRTRISFKRNVTIEHTNFLSNFKNFNISKITLKPTLYDESDSPTISQVDQTIFKKFLFGDYFRMSKDYFKPITIHASLQTSTYEIFQLPCIVFIRTKESIDDVGSFGTQYGEPTGYTVGLIPLIPDSVPFTLGSSQSFTFPQKSITIQYRETAQDNSAGYTLNTETITYSYLPNQAGSTISNAWYELMAEISPYVCQAMYTKVLCYRNVSSGAILLPYSYYGIKAHFDVAGYNRCCAFWVDSTYMFSENQGNVSAQLDNFYFDIDEPLESPISKYFFSKLNLYFYNAKNKIELNLRDYITYYEVDGHTSQRLRIHCAFRQYFTMLGSQLLINFSCPNNSEKKSSVEFSLPYYNEIFSQGDSTNITVEASANFNANNRYYMAMAQNAIDYKMMSSVMNAGSSGTVGMTQVVAGTGTGNPAEIVMGAGNMIRSIFQIGQAFVDMHYMQEAAILQKRNEETKPDTVTGQYAAAPAMASISNFVIATIEMPFDEDFNHWVQNSTLYGYDCEIFMEAIDVEDIEYNNQFSLTCIAETNSSDLSAREYSEMYTYLKGMNYTVY